MQNQKSLAESKLKILEDENKNAEQHFNQLIAEKNEIKVRLERKLGEARNLQNTITQSEENIKTIEGSIVSRMNDIELPEKKFLKLITKLETGKRSWWA